MRIWKDLTNEVSMSVKVRSRISGGVEIEALGEKLPK